MTELLVDRALFGLDAGGRDELDRLRARFPELDDGSLERAAAALALGMLERVEPPPPELTERIAERFEGDDDV
ncbi:MAG: hypothetical protein AAFZ65_03490 [Planctomycetota bacterium]